jgi:hypothetical protein
MDQLDRWKKHTRWVHGLVLAALMAAGPSLCAQTAEQWREWGDRATTRGDHYGASRFYGNALALEPGRLELQWSMAEACRKSNQYPQAAENYEKVVKKDAGRTHPEALRWLAEMQMCMADHDGALRTWNKVKQKEKDHTSFNEQRAENGIKGCALAKELMALPEKLDVEHLPGTVNTYDSEFGARPGPDSLLWFASLRGELNGEAEVLDTTSYRVALYHSHQAGKGWATAVKAGAAINTGGDIANATWNSRGVMYFARCGTGRPCNIMVLIDGAAVPLDGLDAALSATQPMIAEIDGVDRLFFATDRPGGLGGLDIWMANFASDRSVSDLRPLGAPVNTPGNECCPFYDGILHKLYFSSDFHPGMGGYDNFMSVRADDVFGVPQNLRYPLNSPANDLYPTFDPKTGSGFFTSNRAGSLAAKGETCCNDIYRFSHPAQEPAPSLEVDSQIVATVERITTLREKLPILLYFHNDEPEPRSLDTLTAQTYSQTYRAYKALVPEYRRAWKGDTAGIDAFFRNAVDVGHARLNDFIVLLKQALDEGQQVRIVVRGFASPLAGSEYNVNLSLRRIQSMINELRTTHEGALIPYLDGAAPNGARLVIEKAPFGEYRSVEGVSDVLEDLRNSVYGVSASLERRIEIEQVELLNGPMDVAHPVLQQAVIDLGEVEQNRGTQAVFTLKNEGLLPLTILRTQADCGCTHAEMEHTPIPAGGVRSITVDFNGHAAEGPFKRTVTLTTDGDPSTLVLTIQGTIVPTK